jgi:hypothetical protein
VTVPTRRILRDDPHVDWEEESVEFRLTYQGTLLSDNARNASRRGHSAEHKHGIRKIFHRQLKRWWEISPYLQSPPSTTPGGVIFGRPSADHTLVGLAQRFSRMNYNFVPLVTRDLELLCSVEILYLRYGESGQVLNMAGDLDNRLKTLFDALRMPTNASELGGFIDPDDDEKPFFCLLEDDSVITRATAESDMLLASANPRDPNYAHVIITVRIRPGRVTVSNVGFS